MEHPRLESEFYRRLKEKADKELLELLDKSEPCGLESSKAAAYAEFALSETQQANNG